MAAKTGLSRCKANVQIGLTSVIRLITHIAVTKAKQIVIIPNKNADPDEGGGFAGWAMFTVSTLRIGLGKSYRVAWICSQKCLRS